MRTSGWKSVLFALTFALICTPAFAQAGGSGISLSGTVVDKDGGVIPGATVVVKNKATGETQTLVTNSEGAYAIPGMVAGTYTVTVSLQGFKTWCTTMCACRPRHRTRSRPRCRSASSARR